MIKEICLIIFGMGIMFIGCVLFMPRGIVQTEQTSYQTDTVNVIQGVFSNRPESITVYTMARSPAEVEKTLLHEYKHFLDYYTLGKEAYISMPREQREASASLYEATHHFCEGD